MQRKPANRADFSYALKSFTGYLEGTAKSHHTIQNYRSDLMAFQDFLAEGLGSAPVRLTDVTREDLEKFHGWMKAQGLKTNTRRRKLLTVRKLLKYLTHRKKIAIDVGQKLPAPHKVERIPHIVAWDKLVAAIRALAVENDLQQRNQVLLWTLAETGCLVSEVTRLRFEDWTSEHVAIGGKSPRELAVSPELCAAVRALRERAKGPWLFLGFNKFGSLGSPISPRGVELLVKAYLPRLGLVDLTPRTFRHSVVVHWNASGVTRDTIQKRLGLRTAYAFRAYEPLFKSTSAATSTS